MLVLLPLVAWLVGGAHGPLGSGASRAAPVSMIAVQPARSTAVHSLLDRLVDASPEDAREMLADATPMLLYPYRAAVANRRAPRVTLNGAHRNIAMRTMLAVEISRLESNAASHRCRQRATSALHQLREHMVSELELR